ncbi:hypothetical protein MRX96_057466 [Rhipicephalus microplus]
MHVASFMPTVFVLTRPRGSVPGPVLSCYYDPAWPNVTKRGTWVYDLLQHFHTDTCTHAVFVDVEYDYHGIVIPGYVADRRANAFSLANFLTLRRPGLPVLVSVMVRDVTGAALNAILFASSVVKWAIKNNFDSVEVDIPEDTAALGFDTLVKMMFIAANGLLGVALKQLGSNAFRESQECGARDTLFDAVATEFDQLRRCPGGKLPWKSRHVRLTVVHENGRTSCLGIV